MLGAGFECLELDLGADDEGPLVATLVRALPPRRTLWERLTHPPRMLEDVDVLYVHGWSDYFFQRHLAEFWTTRGARFYALDLRKYGRSLREGQTKGYIENLTDYDLEIALALEAMGHAPLPQGAASEPEKARRLVLLGHSTGGLVLSLWADRHRGAADALILNSPWLELQLSGRVRTALAPIVNLRARLTPRELALPQLDLGFYNRAQRMVSDPREIDEINAEWRPQHTYPVLAGWLNAILSGHARVAAGLDVGAPACVLLSTRSQFGVGWRDDMLRADTVIEVNTAAQAALRLGPSVTIERIDGALHDVFISERRARADAFARLDRWLLGWIAVERSVEDRGSG